MFWNSTLRKIHAISDVNVEAHKVNPQKKKQGKITAKDAMGMF